MFYHAHIMAWSFNIVIRNDNISVCFFKLKQITLNVIITLNLHNKHNAL